MGSYPRSYPPNSGGGTMAFQIQDRVEKLVGYAFLALLAAFIAFLIYQGIMIF
jgi:hypothetical protein